MNSMYKNIYFFVFLQVITISSYAKAISLNENAIMLEADRVEYLDYQGERIAKAYGNVEVLQEGRQVNANFMEYNFNKDILLAQDKVKFLEKDGYVIDAEKVTLTNNFKFGSMSEFKILMPDKSTLTGSFAKKENEKITHIDKGSYTSCKICPNKSPIWQFTAKSTKLDQENNTVQYRNIMMKFYGLPVLYSPYFSHYTSKAERKSGFLTAEYGGSTYLGKAIKIPYYFNIAPNQDATAKLIPTTKKGMAFEIEHRYLLPQGQIKSFGSITSASKYVPIPSQSRPKHNIRYNVGSEANLELSPDKNIGWNINTTSDKLYRKDYGYGEEDFLTSKIYHNAYQDNGFYEVQSLAFQNLRPSNTESDNAINQTPLVLPLFESKHRIFSFSDNSSLNFESNLLKIHRYNGLDSNRISIKNTWEKPFTLESGHDFKLFTSLRNDIYHYDKAASSFNQYSGTTSRSIPEAGIVWSYPLARFIGESKVVIAPIASVTITPYRDYNKKIFSEDSSNVSELGEGNLFSKSQFGGIDIVENTPRAGYGVKSIVYYKDHLNVNALFGQMYRHRPQEYVMGSSENRFSDYVGRLQFDLNDAINVSYRYKLDKDNFLNKANEIDSLFKHKKMYLLTSLLYYKDDIKVGQVKNRREIYLETGVNDYNNISASINARKNLSSKKDNPDLYFDPNGFISVGGNIKYLNDCILYSFGINKDYTKSQEKKANTTYWLRISLKNIS